MPSEDKILKTKVALLYGLLGVLFAFWTAASVIGISNTGKASKASVAAIQKKLDPTKEAAVAAACSKVASEANAQGVIITSCKLIKDKRGYAAKKDSAVVVVEAKADTGTFVISVQLSKGSWIATGFQILAAVQKAPASAPS